MYKTEPTGEEQFLGAPRVFVSVQTIESARLFLISEIPDPNAMVGHYLLYHTHANLELTFPGQPVWENGPAYQPRTAIGSLQLRDMYVIDDPDTYLTKGGKFSIYDPLTCVAPIRMVKGASMGPDRSRRLGRRAARLPRRDPLAGRRLLLLHRRGDVDVRQPRRAGPRGHRPLGHAGRTHVLQAPPVRRRPSSKYALTKVADVMSAAGGELRRFEPQTEDNAGYGHVQGTLRAGSDPGASVLDADCQSHTVKGLYVLDCAFMPTAARRTRPDAARQCLSRLRGSAMTTDTHPR